MKVKVLAAALTLFGNHAFAAEPEMRPETTPQERPTEPILCYLLLPRLGFEITVGQSIEVCAATRDAAATVTCFAQAYRHPDEGGLGLNRGQAVDLCRTIPRDDV
jgi:hypothetical protein